MVDFNQIITIEDIKESYTNLKNKIFTNPEVEVVLPKIEILEPGFEEPDYGEKVLRRLERAIRTAYQSFDKIWPESHYKLINHILTLHHESTLEHEKITFKVITNRWVTHELVRHRIASYTQESTRYVKYWVKHWYKIIFPAWLKEKDLNEAQTWYKVHCYIAQQYWNFINNFKRKPQEARGILPNDLKTEIVVTMNFRQLRHFISLRAHPAAHPDIRVIAGSLRKKLKQKIPLIFDKID